MERPHISECPVCRSAFVVKQRVQGGGRRTIYCSPKCRSLDWVHGNGGKRKATVLKYDSKPENKEKKRERMREKKLAKYGWTLENFATQLTRQHFTCAGCLTRVDEKTARVDHDHSTGLVRGILCNSCNWGLGHIRDDPATLRRLMAYLERDITKTLVYLIGSLKNTRVPELGNVLRAKDYDVMDEWCTPGKDADKNWQAYEKQRGRSYTDALRGRAATNTFLFDRAYIDLADVVTLVMPAGKSAMIELGYAKGRGKFTVLFLDGADPDRYDVMPGFADVAVSTESDLLELLETRRIK